MNLSTIKQPAPLRVPIIFIEAKEKQKEKKARQREDRIRRKLKEAAAAAAMLTTAGSAKWRGQKKGGKQSMAPVF